MLHNKCVAAFIDKASSNVVFNCQRYYAQILINGLGLNNIHYSMSLYMRVIHDFGKNSRVSSGP